MATKSKKKEFEHDEDSQEAAVVAAVAEMKKEAREAKIHRLRQNRTNWDMYHGRGRTGHKKKGQSREFLHKSALAAEQIVSLVKSSLMNFDKWIDVTWVGITPDPLFTAQFAKNLLRLYFEKTDIKTVITDAVKVGVHEGLCTIKLTGQMVPAPRYVSNKRSMKIVDEKQWQLVADVVNAEDYFPDPWPGTGGAKMYEIHQMILDRAAALDLASENGEDPEKPYIEDLVLELSPMEGLTDSQSRKARNRGDSMYRARVGRRHPVMIDEFFGTVIGHDGKVLKWKRPDGTEFELRNVMLSIGNERVLVQPPEQNPRWSGRSPFISAPLIRVPFAAWPKAIMDAASALNITLNELFNLMLDGGLSSVHGIKQLHESWLTPETLDEISDHIPPGTTLNLNELAPQTGKALERVDSGEVPVDAMSFFNVVEQLFAENALTNEIRMGSLPTKQVRATEVNASQQSLSGIFDSISSDFEDIFIEKLAEEAWMDILQNVEKFPKADMIRLIGPQKYEELNKMTPAQRFERAGAGFKWQGKGLRTLTQRMKDFQRLVQFLSVVGQNEQLLQEFQLRFSMPKLIGKFMNSLEIDAEEIQLSPEEAQIAEMRQKAQEEAMANAGAEQGVGRQPEIPKEPGEQGGGSGIASGNDNGERRN